MTQETAILDCLGSEFHSEYWYELVLGSVTSCHYKQLVQYIVESPFNQSDQVNAIHSGRDKT